MECDEIFGWGILMVFDFGSGFEFVINGLNFVCVYDLKNGKEFWCFGCSLKIMVLILIVGEGLIVVISGCVFE